MESKVGALALSVITEAAQGLSIYTHFPSTHSWSNQPSHDYTNKVTTYSLELLHQDVAAALPDFTPISIILPDNIPIEHKGKAG